VAYFLPAGSNCEAERDVDKSDLFCNVAALLTTEVALCESCALLRNLESFLGTIERTKTQKSIDPPFLRTMILFHYVVQIRNDSAVTPAPESTLLFQFVNDGRI
jgi:hypothetical protein